MPHRRHRLKRLLSRFRTGDLLVTEASEPSDETYGWDSMPDAPELDSERVRRRFGGHRMAASLTFAVLFFAGAAFTAGAGDLVSTDDTATTEAAAPEAAPAAPAAPGTEPAPPADPELCPKRMLARGLDREECAKPEDAAPAPAEPAPAPALPEAPAADDGQPAAAPSESAPDESSQSDLARPLGAPSAAPKAPDPALAPAPAPARTHTHAKPAAKPVLAPAPRLPTRQTGHEAPDGTPEFGTIWLDRDMPDPTPPSRRLTRAFARDLKATSRKAQVRWSDVLAVLRARGDRSQAPAGHAALRALATRLSVLGAQKNAWDAFLALEGNTSFADRALALSRYHRAVGLSALVRGLEWAKPSLQRKVLRDKRISIYWGGREDIKSDRTNVRILVLLEYLAEAHGQVTVSCLTAGHGYFSRPGVVSMHMYGLAADISALGDTTIQGHQQPGSITEEAVRNILLLPSEMRPRQVISLLGLGGPSFPLANHFDHIHVGY
jgi:hypothetical protein